MCVFIISPVPITEPLTSELIDTPVFYNLAPRPIKYRVSVPIPMYEWRWKLTTDCFSFVCKKSCKVISCYRRGGRWWRGTEEIIKCSKEITHIWTIADLVMEMWRFGSVDFSRERWKKRLIHTQVRRIVWFSPFSLCRSESGPMFTKNIR